jgi:hypothetical protein
VAVVPALLAGLGALLVLAGPAHARQHRDGRTIGVLFVVHGGSAEQDVANTFDSTLQFFQYDPNNVLFKGVLWNPKMWPTVVKQGDSQSYANASTQLQKYLFSYDRIGGTDPASRLTDRQLRDMTRELNRIGRRQGIRYVTDIVQWIGTQGQADRLPWPRWLYGPQVPGGSPLTYCGSETDGGPWKNCDPQRFNVDGPGERLLKQGAEEIVMVDMTVGGTRFWKTYDVVSMTRRMVADWNARHDTGIQVRWVNDPTDLMRDSYPGDPPNWTRSLGPPGADNRVPLEGRPNPVVSDPLLVAMHVDGIVRRFNPRVAPEDTAVLFVNHATRDGSETYDPKVNDTVELDALIKKELLRRHPGMKPENILGSWMGIREVNPAIPATARTRVERTREMRGEDLGSAWLYESDRQLPEGDHRYRYWEALDILRERQVGHIVVIFSQIVVDSVLNLVEVPNQIAKEIGWKTWVDPDRRGRRTYPGVGHPFADYWGVWVDTRCRVPDAVPDGPVQDCCFVLGGCGDGRPYPPPRQTPIDRPRPDTDPSLAFDIPAWGHLGYDPALGPPDDGRPVQGQYRGTWAMWEPPNDDPRMGRLLARQVTDFLGSRQPVAGR